MKKNILFAALMCWSLFLMAGKRDYYKDPKYLLGAVPEVEGIVTFQKNFTVTDKSEQQIYDIVLAYIKNSLVAGSIQSPKSEYTRVISLFLKTNNFTTVCIFVTNLNMIIS